MNITSADIQEYIRLCQDKLDVVISDEQAATELRDLVELMAIAYQPMTTDEGAQIMARRSELGLNPPKEVRDERTK